MSQRRILRIIWNLTPLLDNAGIQASFSIQPFSASNDKNKPPKFLLRQEAYSKKSNIHSSKPIQKINSDSACSDQFEKIDNRFITEGYNAKYTPWDTKLPAIKRKKSLEVIPKHNNSNIISRRFHRDHQSNSQVHSKLLELILLPEHYWLLTETAQFCHFMVKVTWQHLPSFTRTVQFLSQFPIRPEWNLPNFNGIWRS